MDGWKGSQVLVELLKREAITMADFEKAIEIAKEATGKSNARKKAYEYGYRISFRDAYANGVRWLAIIRLQEGPAAFQTAVTNLRRHINAIQSGTLTEWQLASGETVVDRSDSHIMTQHQDVVPYLPEVLSKIDSRGEETLIREVDLNRIIGKTICVETCPGDGISYAQRVGRDGLSRFAKNRQPEPCKCATVYLRRVDAMTYEILTAFIGKFAETEPWDTNATAASRDFWEKHALCWGYQEVIQGTETIKCPW